MSPQPTILTVSLEIDKSLVQSSGHPGASSWQICYASPSKFTALPGTSGTAVIGGLTFNTGLLPGCSGTQGPPCVQHRNKHARQRRRHVPRARGSLRAPVIMPKKLGERAAEEATESARRKLNPGLEPKTVVNTHRMLYRAWKDFATWGWAKRNVVSDAHPPRVPRKGRKVWTVAQQCSCR